MSKICTCYLDSNNIYVDSVNVDEPFDELNQQQNEEKLIKEIVEEDNNQILQHNYEIQNQDKKQQKGSNDKDFINDNNNH